MADEFAQVRALVNRAQKHLDELKLEFKIYLADNPYVVRVEPDGHTGYELHKLAFIKELPDMSAITFDIFNGLRAALDHAVYAAVVAVCGGDPSGTKFPFGDDACKLDDDIRRGCRDVPDGVKSALRSLKPYKGGDDALFALNKLRNRKDHRHLIALYLCPEDIRLLNPPLRPGCHIFPGKWDSSKNEIVFLRAPHGTKQDYGLQFTPGVSLGRTPETMALDYIGTFEDLFGVVNSAISAIEAATKLAKL